MTLLLLLLGCADQPAEGTAVGNPGGAGSLDVVVTDLPEGIALDVADAAVDGAELDDCEGGGAWVDVGRAVDALPGSDDAFEIPGGSWCGVTLSLSPEGAPLLLEGETAGGTTFSVSLAPATLSEEGRFSVDGDALLLGLSLAGTLDAAALEREGADVVVAADDARAVAWASTLEERGELWEDLDGDVDVGEADLAAVRSDGSADAMQSAGCGCAQGVGRGDGGGGGSGWIVLVLGLVWRLDRRRRSPRGA